MPERIAARAGIPPFYVMEVVRAAEERERAGAEVLHLEVGQPATGAPEGVVAAAQAALASGATLGYTTAFGRWDLREAIARHTADWYGVDVDPRRIAVTTGASASFTLAFLACFDQGARVAVTSPGYPCYRNVLAALGVEAVDVPIDASTGFRLTPELLDAAGPLDGVVVASPSNPTGTMLDAAGLEALAGWCAERGAWLVSDEIYHGISYEQQAPTALAASDDAIVVNSFSKYFSMTGWRLGWLVLPERLIAPVERLGQNLYISAPTLSQVAAVAAFDCHEELRANVERYAANRRVLLDGLPGTGLTDLAPADGAFYVWARSDGLAEDSQELCTRWLNELGVAATPGIDFDPARGRSYVRFSFAGATADMREAVRRLQAFRP
ncbi:MAG: aminotransferase class I/II-fold pyridoxal phosphate-dependent enzyme [Thermoleophilia bacterium]